MNPDMLLAGGGRPVPIKLNENNIPAPAGMKLVAVDGPSRIVPDDFISLWQPPDGRGKTVIWKFSLPKWDDVATNRTEPSVELARIPFRLSAIYGRWSEDYKRLSVFAISHADPGQPTYIFSFAWQPKASN